MAKYHLKRIVRFYVNYFRSIIYRTDPAGGGSIIRPNWTRHVRYEKEKQIPIHGKVEDFWIWCKL